jgi:hypothetical protein
LLLRIAIVSLSSGLHCTARVVQTAALALIQGSHSDKQAGMPKSERAGGTQAWIHMHTQAVLLRNKQCLSWDKLKLT